MSNSDHNANIFGLDIEALLSNGKTLLRANDTSGNLPVVDLRKRALSVAYCGPFSGIKFPFWYTQNKFQWFQKGEEHNLLAQLLLFLYGALIYLKYFKGALSGAADNVYSEICHCNLLTYLYNKSVTCSLQNIFKIQSL